MRQFVHGERAKLAELAAIHHIWEIEVGIDAPFFVMDFCCLGLDENGRVVDEMFLVSYNQPDAPKGAITLNNASNNGAIFTVFLERLPREIRRLVFTATQSQSLAPNGLLGAAFSILGGVSEIGQGHFVLRTPAIETGVFEFSGQDFSDQATLIIGEIYWRHEWRFVAAAQPLREELDVFLRRLSEGPMPAPVTKNTLPMPARPPRPPAPTPQRVQVSAPKSHTPQSPLHAKTPHAPTPTVPTAPAQPPIPSPTPIRPLAAPRISNPVAVPVSKAVTVPPAWTPDPALLPRVLEPRQSLQDLIEKSAEGETLILQGDEYEGPIFLRKPLCLQARQSAIWARSGPVVTIDSPGVILRDCAIEVTLSHSPSEDASIALRIGDSASLVVLENVQVKGKIDGLAEEDGEWELPDHLDLGEFAPRIPHHISFEITVPTRVQILSVVEGVSAEPSQVDAGRHQITLRVHDITPDALLVGFVEIRSSWLSRAISLRGRARSIQAAH